MDLEFPPRQHHTIRQEASAKDFGSIQSFEIRGILCVFPDFGTEEVGQKIRRNPKANRVALP